MELVLLLGEGIEDGITGSLSLNLAESLRDILPGNQIIAEFLHIGLVWE